MVAGKRVLEVGARDENGSLRPYLEEFEPALYVGVDARAGRRVDALVRAEDLPRALRTPFDLVISTEMLEHARDWRGALYGLMWAVRPGGRLLLTTRSPGFPRHDYGGDYWRFTKATLRRALGGFDLELLEDDPQEGHPGVLILARRRGRITRPSTRLRPQRAPT